MGVSPWRIGGELLTDKDRKLARQCYHLRCIYKEFVEMPEAEVKNIEFTPKPKCLRCGSEHTVSDVGHWLPGWWTCQICNIRWEEDEYET